MLIWRRLLRDSPYWTMNFLLPWNFIFSANMFYLTKITTTMVCKQLPWTVYVVQLSLSLILNMVVVVCSLLLLYPFHPTRPLGERHGFRTNSISQTDASLFKQQSQWRNVFRNGQSGVHPCRTTFTTRLFVHLEKNRCSSLVSCENFYRHPS